MTTLKTLAGDSIGSLAFGTMQWGGTADDAASEALFEQCRATGIRHFDTAVAYTDGASERLLGRFAAPERDRLFVATKVGYMGGAGAANIHAQFDQSRRQLKMDMVDLLYMHRFDPETPLEQTFETLRRLQDDGAIRHIGVSNYAAWQVMKAQSVCAALGTQIDAIQPMYNLVKRQAEVELLPMAADQDIAVFAYSPLGGGLLTGKYDGQTTGRLTDDKRYAARYAPADMHAAATKLSQIAQRLGQSPATLAVAWVMSQGANISPIISARSTAQLEPSLLAKDITLEEDVLAELSTIFPSPAPATDRLEEQ